MPFITTAPKKPVRMHDLIQIQHLDDYCAQQDRLERDFKIKFGICLVAAVFSGSFLWAVMVF